MKKKEITIEDLARITQNGFLGVDKELKGVNKRLDKVEARLTGVENRLGKVEGKLDSIEANLNKKVDKVDHNTLDYRVEKLEKKFA